MSTTYTLARPTTSFNTSRQINCVEIASNAYFTLAFFRCQNMSASNLVHDVDTLTRHSSWPILAAQCQTW